MYRSLRSDKKLTYEKIIEYFVKNGSDKWSESIYNEDADYKYISMLRSDNDATNLYQVKGKGEEHLEYFASNRLKYYDSKCYAADYADNYVALRIYTPTEWSGVAPNANITITPFSNMYAGVRYKANGTLYQKRVAKNEIAAFSPQGENFEAERNETFNDTETAIYGASEISSLGDLAPLYCGSINVSKASRLIELKVGDSTEGYVNNNLTELSLGTNKLLKKVDVRNCPKLTEPLSLVGCPNIEEIYATGSGITSVELPKSGYLKKIHLPGTITNLTLQNQLYIEDLRIASYENISTLNIENCPTLDEVDILNKCTNLRRVRLADVNWTFADASSIISFAEELLSSGIKGVDENGENVDTPQISGRCYITALTGEEYATIKAAFPYMKIAYSNLTTQLIFMLQNGTELTRQTILNGGNGYDPIKKGDINAPAMSSTAQYHFTFAGGWTEDPYGETVNENALLKVESDRILYPVFTRELRKYNVYFYNDTELLQTVENVPYGDSVEYLGDDPVNNSTGNPDDFRFTGWYPLPENITGETRCYAQFADMREITDSWATIAANAANGTATTLYSVDRPVALEMGAVELPYGINDGSAVIFNDEIHIMGGGSSNSYRRYHYKWNGTEWVSVSTLPYSFYQGSAVVYNDEIHIMGSYGDLRSHYKWNGTEWISVSTLPYNLYDGSTVVYNDEIHIFGGSYDKTAHYKWNETEWVSVSTLPFEFYNSSAVIYDDEIHLTGGTGFGHKYHYKWNGTEWVSVSTLPYSMLNRPTVVYNDEIHILGSNSDRTAHHKWNGTEWVSVSTLPKATNDYSIAVVLGGSIHLLSVTGSNSGHYIWNGSEWIANGASRVTFQVAAHNQDAYPDGAGKGSSLGTLPYAFDSGCAIMYDGEIHIMSTSGSSSYYKEHYKWNGSEWVSVSTLPYILRGGSAVVYNDEIHIMGGIDSDSSFNYHYKWNGTEWISVGTLPYKFRSGQAVVLSDEIHIIGSYEHSYRKYHYKWNGTEWVSVSTLPYSFYQGSAVVFNDEIHIMGTEATSIGKYHYKWNGTEWISVGTLPYRFYQGSAVVYNDEIHIMGGIDSDSSFNYHYKWNGTEWISVGTLPYKFYKGSAVVFNDEIHIMGGYHSSTQRSFYSITFDNPTATLTFIGKFLLKDKHAMNTFNTNAGGWSAMALREYLNGEFITSLPKELQTALTTVKKMSDTGYDGSGVSTAVASNDKVWLLSADEIRDGNAIYPTIFKNANSRIKTTMDGTPSKWWLRDSNPEANSSWYCVDENGEICTMTDLTEAQGVLIGFCIG